MGENRVQPGDPGQHGWATQCPMASAGKPDKLPATALSGWRYTRAPGIASTKAPQQKIVAAGPGA